MISTPAQGALERRLGALLGYGTGLGSAVIAAGLLWPWVGGRDGRPAVMAGIVIVILLPVLRLVLMLFAFLRARDHRFALLAAAVLAIVGLGVLAGLYPAARH